MKFISIVESDVWEVRVRWSFWITGTILGGLLCYTTRHYINGDALTYIEMGEALRRGNIWGLVNLTYSPGYPILAGIWQALLATNPMNEVQLHKILNFVCFLFAMAACDRFIRILGDENRRLRGEMLTPLPIVLMSALCCAAFLATSLKWVRIQLISPDMLLYAVILACATLLLQIKRDPTTYKKYALLGVMIGIGYVVKSFFFVFSAVLFLAAGLAAGSVRRAAPRVFVAIVAMFVVASPLVGALSYRMGKFSYGELGKWSYVHLVSGEGSPIHPPKTLNEKPRVLIYDYPIRCTQPATFDVCHWETGIKPKFDLQAQVHRFVRNVKEIFRGHMVFFILAGWLLIRRLWASYDFFTFRPPSTTIVLLIPAVLGTALYCLLYMEPRYIAAFFFLGGSAVVSALRYQPQSIGYRIGIWGSMVVILFLVTVVFGTVFDQSRRSLHSIAGKPSHREVFLRQNAVRNFLSERGIQKGDEVAVVTPNPRTYWARFLGIGITGAVEDRNEFLSSESGRSLAVDALKKAGIEAIVAKGKEFRPLVKEGWMLVPGTVEYYVLLVRDTRGDNSAVRFTLP